MEPVEKASAAKLTAEVLRRELLAGRWHEQVPGTRVLAEHLRVSAPTVGLALNLLVEEGLLVAGGPRRAYRVAGKPGPARLRRTNSVRRELLILIPVEFTEMMEHARRLLELLTQRMAEREWRVRQKVIDYLHSTHPHASWDQRIAVEEGTRVIAVYGRAALAEWATRRGVPMFFLGGDAADFDIATVAVNSTRMADDVMGRLTALGHRRIVLPLFDRTDEFKAKLREATRRSVERAGDTYIAGYHNPESDYKAPDVMRRLLTKIFSKRAPTAMVLLDWNEMVAVTSFLAERGLRVPRDVSLAMLSDSATAEWYHPTLCRFRYPQRRILSEMIKWLEEKPGSEKHTSLSGIYVAGDSIGPPPPEVDC